MTSSPESESDPHAKPRDGETRSPAGPCDDSQEKTLERKWTPRVDESVQVDGPANKERPLEEDTLLGQKDGPSSWDEVASRSMTGFAPTFARPADSRPLNSPPPRPHAPPERLDPGDRIDDFEILRVLGQGAFGTVYLARQVSLDREIALKVSRNQGSEGRTMAQLEHDNIVQVFSETVSDDGQRRLLCMQYVPGTTLEAVIRTMHGDQDRQWRGASILELLDTINPDAPPFHPAALRERQELGRADSVEAVCWIGARLAEALAYAHEKGVLHRDIKPANILQTRYGRPLLADFNLAFQPVDVTSGDEALFGGTLAYMSPEHLDAFHPGRKTTPEQVDERSDIFSLGVVLYELATGQLGLPPADGTLSNLERLERISLARQTLPPPLPPCNSPASRAFDRTVRKCLCPDPDGRFQSASVLAESLEGCRELSEVEKHLPAAGPITRSALRHPFVWLVLLVMLPHLPIGSTVNIAYNGFRIVGHLSPSQKTAFNELLIAYNLIVYPICIVGLLYFARPVYVAWRRLGISANTDCPVDGPTVDAARILTTRWPLGVVLLACIGWLPGSLFFPLGLHWRAGPVDSWVFYHFAISCTLSGLIAMTYSYFAIQYLAIRVFYPHLWHEVRKLRSTATVELRGFRPYAGTLQVLAGLVPLAGAVLVIALGPEGEASYGEFQFLTTTLIVLGFCGFQLANRTSALNSETVNALTKKPGGEVAQP